MGEIKVKREKRKDEVSPCGDGIFFAIKAKKAAKPQKISSALPTHYLLTFLFSLFSFH